ncbi:MAG: molecular chaperone HtpG [Eubacteriales bacterium]|nr:molecular chaperone HtpG [Christensenellaceae bacterium]MEA5066109.1 molecular chaperone HtpG [Eubacteriales bacterium]
MAQKGSISIHAENIMPVIKRWLYSDKDIFLRELVANGCDAVAKHRALARAGEAAAEDSYRVDVIADEAQGTLKIVDNGIGMTEDEVTRFIAQVAFSGAEEFLAKYKPDDASAGIIGHFGLGFYSAFMVSSQVSIDTLSYRENASAVRWESSDGMTYEMGPSERDARGTTITLTLNEGDREFLHLHTLRDTLEKYCAFMPVPIFLSAVEAVKEGEEAKAPEQVNETVPLWTKRPNEVTDEEYKAFYHKVFRDYGDPLFWIHLNAEYPFNLKGILYFPRIKHEFAGSEGVIKLFSNQVFVADNIKEVIPEFLMLLKGAIDCPDLPLNVSRSFLQNDGYVRKMSQYITRKVADRLVSEFTGKREDYQKYWDDIHPFVKYGAIRDEKFYERVKDALLFKTTDDRYLTLKEYGETQFEGDERTVYYSGDPRRQAQMIELYRAQNRDVVVLDTLIDPNFISFLEYAGDREHPIKFERVDAGTLGLTEAGDADEDKRAVLEAKFRKALNQESLKVLLKQFKTDSLPAVITVDEQSRRFGEMSRAWGDKGFKMPEQQTLTLNERHPLVQHLAASGDEALDALLCEQIYDLCEMARSPLESERMVAFLSRSQALLTRLIEK